MSVVGLLDGLLPVLYVEAFMDEPNLFVVAHQITEAYCVLNGIPVVRKFSDEELREAMERVRAESSSLNLAP